MFEVDGDLHWALAKFENPVKLPVVDTIYQKVTILLQL